VVEPAGGDEGGVDAEAERRSGEFTQLMAAARVRLERIYGENLPRDAMRARKAEAFAALGDRADARQALVMASAMSAGSGRAELAERMHALRERLEGRVPAASGGGIVSLSALSAAGD
jgi:predicted aminopeptidase